MNSTKVLVAKLTKIEEEVDKNSAKASAPAAAAPAPAMLLHRHRSKTQRKSHRGLLRKTKKTSTRAHASRKATRASARHHAFHSKMAAHHAEEVAPRAPA